MEFLKDNWIKAPLILYAIGFVVHNAYLATFGSYEFELVQAKYILSGLGVLIFNSICFAYISIKVNLSNIFDSFHIDKLLPWLLRVVSLPYVIYAFLYFENVHELLRDDNVLVRMQFLFFGIAYLVSTYSIFDLILMNSEGPGISARLHRGVFRVLAIPMVIATLVIAWNDHEFSSVVKTSTYLFFGFLGIGFRQMDRAHNIEPKYLDENAEEKHEDMFQYLFGILAIEFILWSIVSNYVDSIYPKPPAALGGARIEDVNIYYGDTVLSSRLIQETDDWVLYINAENNRVEKIKTSSVDKIVFIGMKNQSPNRVAEGL